MKLFAINKIMNTNMKDKSNKQSRTYDLYLGHVPKTIQEAPIMEIFSKYGKVVDVLIRHSTGTGTFGYAIVKFAHKKDAEKVLQNVKTIMVGNHEMEIKNGKRSSQSVDNANGSSKSVTFAEPCFAIQHADGNICMSETPVFINDFHCPVYPASETALLPVTVEIMCTNVEDAITFHGCILTNFEELSRLSMKLNSICPNLQRLTRKPVINKIYGGLFSADCMWYRCRVLQYGPHTNSSTCIVEYIDYGNVAEINYTNMVELPEPLKNITPFAIKCFLTNLVPTSKSRNSISYLHHLVNRRMSLCALNAWGSLEYLVTKCSCNGIDVINELLRNGSAMFKKQEGFKNTSPKMVKSSKMQENKKQKKQNDNHKNKPVSSSNDAAKHSHEMKNGGITILEKSDRSSSSIESPDFTPKRIIKRGKDAVSDSSILEAKAVNHLLKVDSVISSVKVINNIRSLIPLHSYDDLISEAVDLLKNEMNIAESDDSKQLVEKARKAYSEALKEIKECSDLNLLPELKEKRNQKQTELFKELEQYLKSFDCTLLEKRKKIQETITALESNSTAWLNVYLPKIPETIEELLVSFNEEKEKKLKNIEMARKNTDEKREKFLKIYTDLGKEFSLSVVSGAADGQFVTNNIGKKGSWALKFDEALTEFGIALEEERKISTVIEDRSYVSVIQCILEKLDVPKERIDAECDVYEKYKSLYDDLNSLNLNPIFGELHEVSKVINSFSSCSNHAEADKVSDGHFNLHSALLREDELLNVVIKASTQHFPELIAEHPELRLEDYQRYFCLLKFSWDVHFFPPVDKCSRIEPSYVSSLGDEPVVIKEFNVGYEYKKNFIKRVKIWNEIKSAALVKIRGLFKNMHNSKRCDETSCKWKTSIALANSDAGIESQAKVQEKVVHDENQNTVSNMNGESRGIIETNCNWSDCETGLMAHDELILHVFEDHVGKDDKPFVCRWKDCPTKEKPFKTQELLILHMRNHVSEKSLACTSRNIIYAVLPNAWESLYDKPLPIPVDYKMALNILQQVLEGLCNIHSRGIVHGAIHPMAILHKEGKILLDFNFDKQLLKDKLCINGINFQVPKEDFKSADMYGFGCLVLLVLFPNLLFQSTDEGVPNISAFQSIIENMLIPKDFDALYSLLKANCNIRPTSRMLRSNGFLKELSIMIESSSL